MQNPERGHNRLRLGEHDVAADEQLHPVEELAKRNGRLLRLLLHFDQLLKLVTSGQVVARVLALDRFDDPYGSDPAGKRRVHLLGMPVALLVLVGDDHDLPGAGERVCVLVSPLAGAHRVTGGDGTGHLDRLHVLLALADVDGLAGGDRLEHARQPVEHPSNAFQVPDPVRAVRPALREALRLLPHGLREQLPVLVDVGIDGNGSVAGRRGLTLEQVLRLEADCGDDLLERTAGPVASEQHPSVLAHRDAQRRVAILMGGAGRLPAVTGALHSLETLEHTVERSHDQKRSAMGSSPKSSPAQRPHQPSK
jgi:hypothetical protein